MFIDLSTLKVLQEETNSRRVPKVIAVQKYSLEPLLSYKILIPIFTAACIIIIRLIRWLLEPFKALKHIYPYCCVEKFSPHLFLTFVSIKINFAPRMSHNFLFEASLKNRHVKSTENKYDFFKRFKKVTNTYK